MRAIFLTRAGDAKRKINLTWPRAVESRYRGYRRYREASDLKGKKCPMEKFFLLTISKRILVNALIITQSETLNLMKRNRGRLQ